MRVYRLLLAGVLALAAASLVVGQDIPTLVDQAVSGSDEARLAVIQVGLPAIPALAEVIATREGRPAERAARTLGWVIEFAGKDAAIRPRAEWTAVNLLLDSGRPMAVRQTVARYMWHVASSRSVAALAPFVADPDLGPDALWSLQNIPGEAALKALWSAAQPYNSPLAAKAVAAMGRRSDVPLGYLKDAVQAGNPAVRLAAIEGLGNMAVAPAAHALLSRVPLSEGDERAGVLAALNQVAASLPAASARWVYLQVLDAGPATREAVGALNGLASVADCSSVAPAANCLARGDAALAVAACDVLANVPCDCATGVLVAALDGATEQVARPVLSALGQRGDPTALPAVIPFVRVNEPDVQILALSALGNVGDPAACEAILEAAQDPKSLPRVATVALDAYATIADAQLAASDTETARGIYESALRLAKTDAQKARALTGLARTASPKSLPAIRAALDADGDAKDAAVVAYVACSDSLARSGDTGGAIDALMVLLDVLKDPAHVRAIVLRLGALGSSIDVGSRQGFITHWWALGHYDSGPDYAATDEIFAPEKGPVDLSVGDGDRQWKKVHTLDMDGIVDYRGLFGKDDDAACYAYAEVTLQEALDGKILCGSDDSIVVWLNGEEVHRFRGPRGCTVDEDTANASFRAGTNVVLIKVIQGSGDWSSCVRLVDGDGKPLSFEQKTE